MKGLLAGGPACSAVAAAMLAGMLAGCVASSADVEDEAPPVSTALSSKAEVLAVAIPAHTLPSNQASGGVSASMASPTPMEVSDPSDDPACPGEDPEPSPWIPSDAPPEAHVK